MSEKKGLLRKFQSYDLIIISVMAALGIALKPIIVPLAHLITGPLMIPSGAFAGGLYMLWLTVGFGITGKRGTPTLIGLVQAIIVMLTGVAGSHGFMTLISYTLPGLAADAGLFLIGHKVCCRPCAFLSGLLANVAGTFAVNFIFFRLPILFLLLTLCAAAISGGIGGLIAWQLLKLLHQYHFIQEMEFEEETDEKDSI